MISEHNAREIKIGGKFNEIFERYISEKSLLSTTTKESEEIMANEIIRETLKKTKMTQWQLADILGVHETKICREFRKELPEERQQEILKIIEENRRDV